MKTDLHRRLDCQSLSRRVELKKGELAEGVGRSRGGRISKVHAAVDAKGRPVRLTISGGHVHDSQFMDIFLNWQSAPLAMMMDEAYGSIKIRQAVADEGVLAVISAKSNAHHPVAHDQNLYAMRIIVERFFCRMKDMRRVATRFEKSACNFLNMLYIFSERVWIN